MMTLSSNSTKLAKVSSALLFTVFIAGCYPMSPQPFPKPAKKIVVVGSDRDAYGCIPSAGYSYCARTQRCERPWELAAQQGFISSSANFTAWCSNTPYPSRPLNQLHY